METPRKTVLIATLLNKFHVGETISPTDIKDVVEHDAKRYASTKIFSFRYNGRSFFISDDYSLNDSPRRVEALIQDIKPTAQGHIISNPEPQSDDAKYALGLNGTEYYLWEEDTSTPIQ